MTRLNAEAEQALVAQCRQRNFESFGLIVDAYQNRILGYVKRMVKDPEDALDITQEVFVKAFQAFDRFDGRSSLRTWLFRIAHNLCIDRARKIERSPNTLNLEPADPDAEEWQVADERWNPESLVMDGELMDLVEQSLSTMSERLRTVLILHDAEDMAYEEIAETLNVPVGTVKSRLFLARAHLKASVLAYRQEVNEICWTEN